MKAVETMSCGVHSVEELSYEQNKEQTQRPEAGRRIKHIYYYY